jgi:pimeloyl-ACP methyl ester carboxylesterase
MLAAHMAATGDKRINSLALLNTPLHYGKPGNFTDEQTVAQLEREMAGTGVLDGAQMAGTFDVLRANDLIFSYVVTNWLMGQSPPTCAANPCVARPPVRLPRRLTARNDPRRRKHLAIIPEAGRQQRVAICV